MVLKIKLGQLNYDKLIKAFSPSPEENANPDNNTGFTANILKFLKNIPVKVFTLLSQEKKDKVFLYFFNSNKEVFKEKLQEFINQKDLDVEIVHMELSE